MREIVLAIRRSLQLPVDCREISPTKFTEKSMRQIETTKAWEGNRRIELADIFQVAEKKGEGPDETSIRIVGDAAKIRKVGYKMSGGSLIVDGNAGMYLGEEMSGGSILASGNAGSWLGTKMRGGQIEVKGNAADYIGAGYRGTTLGMKNGSIIIHGNAGHEVGCWMANGTIRIKGSAGIFPGIHMADGTIFVGGNCDGRAGAQMKGGKVIIGGQLPSILPSFSFEQIQDKVKVGEEKVPGPFYAFSGDMNEEGKGRLSVSLKNNPHLKWYEKYLEA